MMTATTLSAAKIAQRAGKIYQEKHQKQCEPQHNGKCAVIDIEDGSIYLGDFPEDAMRAGVEASPNGIFHLMRIGTPNSFRLGYLGSHYVTNSTGSF